MARPLLEIERPLTGMLAALDVRWWAVLHIGGVVGFLLFHGVAVTVAFRLRKERDRERIGELLRSSGSSAIAMFVSLGVLVLGGVIAAIEELYWGQFWIWAAIVLVVLSIAEMSAVARPYYRRVRQAVEVRPSGVPRKSDEELDQLLRSPVPVVNTAIGFAVLLAIVYLMVFKPA
ncbi:MAG: DUF2269 family protein [Actinobacteria bacterium]|nr:DUF2269 family protein [Actinomycetota bacterium]